MSRYCCILFAVAVVGAVSVPADAQITRDPEAEAAYTAGKEQLKQEKWEEAIADFSKAISIDSGYAEAYLGRADALRALEDYSTALENYSHALEMNDQLASAYNGRGVCYREMNQIDLALSDFNNASDLDRRDPEIAANLGNLLIDPRVNDPVSALRWLDKAIELDPKNAEAYRNRGWAHAQMREFDQAIADLKKSIELDPEEYETYSTLASIYFFQDDFKSGIEAISQAIEKYKPKKSSDPEKYISGYLSRADAKLRLAKKEDTDPARRKSLFEEVIADTDVVLGEFPDRYPEAGVALLRRGLALRLLGRFAEASKALTDAIQLVPAGSESPYLAEAYLKRGICWHYQGQDSLARGDFQEAASIDFEDPLPQLWIGFTYAQEQDYRAAIESYGEAIAKDPSFALAYVNRGLAYMQLGEFKKAIENFNEAIRNEPTHASHFYKRGVAHLRLHEYQKAFDSFHLATLNDENMAEAFDGAAKALKGLGRSELAAQYERRANALKSAGS